MVQSDQEELSNEELGQLATVRGSFYRFFSALMLKPPSKDMIDNIRDGNFLKTLKEVFGEESAQPLHDYLKDFDGDMEDLKIVHASLFQIPMKSSYVTPYESVYKTGMMNQAPLMKVRKLFKSLDIEVSKEFLDSVDHVGIELEFMAIMCEREAHTWVQGDMIASKAFLNLEEKFLKEHLLSWVPGLYEKVLEKDPPFYAMILKLLTKYLELDLVQIKVSKGIAEVQAVDEGKKENGTALTE